MLERFRLLLKKDPYLREGNEGRFFAALRRTVKRNAEGSAEYAEMLSAHGFSPDLLKGEGDLHKLPPIPTLYFKRRRLFCVPERKLVLKALSSGTSGQRSEVGFDRSSLLLGIGMMYRFFRRHGVISLVPANYIVVGYEPTKQNSAGAVKTAYGTTKFAPALHREYALKYNGKEYELNVDGVKNALLRYEKSRFPVRFVGFPAFMYFLLKLLESEGITLSLNARSMVLLGGGWKEFAGEEIDREEFFSLIETRLGIKRERCLEFYSAVEHPHAYVKCPCGRFHIPLYTRVLIRDRDTLEPLPAGEAGLLNFITPLMTSMPLASVLTDDIAVYGNSPCECGNPAPYFELIGRAGAKGIKTCTAEAAELMSALTEKRDAEVKNGAD